MNGRHAFGDNSEKERMAGVLAPCLVFSFCCWGRVPVVTSTCLRILCQDLLRHVTFVRATFGGLLLTFGCCDIWAERELSNGFHVKFDID